MNFIGLTLPRICTTTTTRDFQFAKQIFLFAFLFDIQLYCWGKKALGKFNLKTIDKQFDLMAQNDSDI